MLREPLDDDEYPPAESGQAAPFSPKRWGRMRQALRKMDENVGVIDDNQHILETRMRELPQQILQQVEARIAEIPRPSPLAIAPAPQIDPSTIIVNDFAINAARIRLEGIFKGFLEQFQMFKKEVRTFQLAMGLLSEFYQPMPEPRTGRPLPGCLMITPEKDPGIIPILQLANTDEGVKGNEVRRFAQEVIMEVDDAELAAHDPKQFLVPSHEVFDLMIARMGDAITTFPDERVENNPNHVYDTMENHIRGQPNSIVGIWRHDGWRVRLATRDLKDEEGKPIPPRPHTLADLFAEF
jgi:hypothetical protein